MSRYSITRTNYNALVDDDGSNTVGTPIVKTTFKDVLLDPIDAVIAPLVTSATSSATPTPNADTTSLFCLTAQAAAAAFATPSGTPVNGQELTIRIKDNGTARAITWSSAYAEGGAPLPSTTLLSKILTAYFIYNTDNTLNKWQCVRVAQESYPYCDNRVCDGRLTLTTATPVTTSDVTAAATVYFTPYAGNRIALYDGAAWTMLTFAEISIALGTLTNDLPYDVFAYNNAGVVACEILAWTSKTARATALVLQDGVLSKTGALTRRYLGSFHTTATTTTEDSLVKRLLFNYYNRVQRALLRTESASSWTYSTATWRQANANTANQIAIMNGYPETCLRLAVSAGVQNNNVAATAMGVGIGEDSTSTPSANAIGGDGQSPGSLGALIVPLTAMMTMHPPVGYHFYAALEYSAANVTTTFNLRAGIVGSDNKALISGSCEG